MVDQATVQKVLDLIRDEVEKCNARREKTRGVVAKRECSYEANTMIALGYIIREELAPELPTHWILPEEKDSE